MVISQIPSVADSRPTHTILLLSLEYLSVIVVFSRIRRSEYSDPARNGFLAIISPVGEVTLIEILSNAGVKIIVPNEVPC